MAETNKLLIGIMSVLATVGSKHIHLDINKKCDKILQNELIRKLIILSIVYINTKDIETSIIVTLIFHLITQATRE